MFDLAGSGAGIVGQDLVSWRVCQAPLLSVTGGICNTRFDSLCTIANSTVMMPLTQQPVAGLEARNNLWQYLDLK